MTIVLCCVLGRRLAQVTDRDWHDSLAPEDDWFAEPPAAPATPTEPVPVAPEPSSEPVRPTHRDRQRTLWAIGLVAVAVALVGAALAWMLGGGTEDSAIVTTTTTTIAEPTTTEPTAAPTTPTTAPEETTSTTTEPEPTPATVRQGDSGEGVRAVQQALAGLGYDVGVDGNFGAQTAAAVVAFQTASGLEPDGVVGPATHVALARAAAG